MSLDIHYHTSIIHCRLLLGVNITVAHELFMMLGRFNAVALKDCPQFRRTFLWSSGSTINLFHCATIATMTIVWNHQNGQLVESFPKILSILLFPIWIFSRQLVGNHNMGIVPSCFAVSPPCPTAVRACSLLFRPLPRSWSRAAASTCSRANFRKRSRRGIFSYGWGPIATCQNPVPRLPPSLTIVFRLNLLVIIPHKIDG